MTDKENLNKSCSSGYYILYVISRNTDTRYNTDDVRFSSAIDFFIFYSHRKGNLGLIPKAVAKLN